MVTSEKLQKRAARFQSEISSGRKKRPFSLVLTINSGPMLDAGEADLDWESFPIVGTCRDLEKQYLRLTSVSLPLPSLVPGGSAGVSKQRPRVEACGELASSRWWRSHRSEAVREGVGNGATSV